MLSLILQDPMLMLLRDGKCFHEHKISEAHNKLL